MARRNHKYKLGTLRVIALSVVALLSTCAPSNQPALRIGANIWPGHEPMYIAQAIGRYDAKQIHVIDFPSAVEVARAYRNGVIDVAALTADEAFSAIAAEPGKHRIILVADYSSGADCILTQPSVTDFSQLRGRRIGVESNALGGYVLLRALQLHTMSVADVELVPMSVDRHVLAFTAGSIDAVVTFEPSRSTLLAGGAQELFTSKEIPGEVIDVIVTRTDLLHARRAALLQFVRGWFEGLAHMRREPADAMRRSAIHEHTAPETFLASLQGLEFVDRDRNLRLLGSGAESIERALVTLATTMRDGGLLATSVEVRGLTDRSIVEQATP